MKILLFTSLILYSLCLNAMEEDQSSRGMPIGRHDNKTLTVSYSPGNWAGIDASNLDARRAHAIIEHQEAARTSDATEMVAFMGGQSLGLIGRLTKELSVPMGDSEINGHLQEMLKKIRSSSKDQSDNLSDSEENLHAPTKLTRTDILITHTRKNPKLREKMEEIIVEQALLINQILRSLGSN